MNDLGTDEIVPKRLWWRQIRAVMDIEIKKHFWGKRSLALYLLTMLPVLVVAINAYNVRNGMRYEQKFEQYEDGTKARPEGDERFTLTTQTAGFARFYSGFLLQVITFFTCLRIFLGLFRVELMERGLHFYFLSPIRRDLLVVGKFLSGFLPASLLLGVVTILCVFLHYLPYGWSVSRAYLFDGPGLAHGLAYLGTTVMACLGYGTLFFLFGFFFKNSVVPAVILFIYEVFSFLWPALLKKFTIIFYLQSITPIPTVSSAFAIVAEPVGLGFSLPGFLLFTAGAIAMISFFIRRMDIRYI